MLNHKLLDLLVCPLCKGKLIYKKDSGELLCKFDRLAFPIRQNIPIMLDKEARVVTIEELEK